MSDVQDSSYHNQLKNRFRGYFPVIIDVETAGFDAKQDALLELAAITLKMDENGYLHPDQKCHFHIEPFEGANINPESLKFNGIDIHNPLRNAGSELDAITGLFQMVRRAQKEADCQRSITQCGFRPKLRDGGSGTHKRKTQPVPPFWHVRYGKLSRLNVRSNRVSQSLPRGQNRL